MLVRFDPFNELDRLTDRLFSNGWTKSTVAMPLDAYKHGEEFIVNVDIPGVDPESIEVTVDQDTLTISAERKWQPAEDDYIAFAERPHGKFTRQLFLGEALDQEKLEAHYDNGVLTIKIPVAQSAKPRRIPVASKKGEKQLVEAQAKESA
jgi:HSP20 family protein